MLLGFTKNIIKAVFAGALIAGILLTAEFIFSLAYPSYRPAWDHRELGAAFVVGILIATTHHHKTALFLGASLILLQSSAFLYFSYFGAFYSPSDIYLLFSEYEDALESALGALNKMLPALTTSAAMLALLVALHKKLWPTFPKSRISTTLAALTLIAPAIDANLQDDSQKFEPDSASLGIKNALYAHAFVLGHDLPRRLVGEAKAHTYKPYKAERLPEQHEHHVVLVIGESLTFAHMGAFGYERDTTPHLSAWMRNGQAMIMPSISAAVSTRVSIPMLMNIQYEPDNLGHISLRETPLFKLAKKNGYQTAFISTQKMDGISSALSGSDIDYWIEQRDMGKYPGQYDERLIHALKNTPIDWSKPSFIVLNQRAAHSPYSKNYPDSWRLFSRQTAASLHEQTVNEYDDAVRFVDQNLAEIITTLHGTATNLPILLIMTADHGEKLGENGTWGHNTLDFPTARVPFIFYPIHEASSDIIDKVKKLPCPLTHYEISKLMASFLGYHIENPNEQPGIYFINGTDIMGRAGFKPYSKAEAIEPQTCQRLGWTQGE
ncbi:MAG: phosphoethanolamine transferase [Halothiobacillaceae bacterium]